MKKMHKSIVLHVRVTEDLKALLEAEAEMNHMNLCEIIRDILMNKMYGKKTYSIDD
jgi:hypothetical protein